MNRLSKSYYLVRYFGVRWILYRIFYIVQNKSGWLSRKAPAQSWDDIEIERAIGEAGLIEEQTYFRYRQDNAPKFFFDPRDQSRYREIFSSGNGFSDRCVGEADRILKGEFLFFGHQWRSLGFPPDWHKNAFTDELAPKDVHWSRIDEFAYGDVKIIWEPSRFAWVYTLVRAFWRTGDERFAEAFWMLMDNWMKENPPNQGINWKCGQEAAFRVMALSFGLYGFIHAKAATPQRVKSLALLILVSGRRIRSNISYAVSQRNNHGISEAMGLWTIGLLFPEIQEVKKWKELGRRLLEQQGRSLIYNDGSFAQHSTNYHRLMLHDYLWAIRLGELNDSPLSDELKERVGKAVDFLWMIQDQESGRVPRYGQNDGALILPLSDCDSADFRPVVQAGSYLTRRRLPFSPGAWDEDCLWLFGPGVLQETRDRAGRAALEANDGGYYTLRSQTGFMFTRCASFLDRPGQADLLHVDFWWKGRNILIDPGTYSYNALAPWNNPFSSSLYHNTLTVDGRDQMERVGKFMWLPWIRGKVNCRYHSPDGAVDYFEGEHDGYLRGENPVAYRRGIFRMGDSIWVIIDRVESRRPHDYRLHWLFQEFPYQRNEEENKLTLNVGDSRLIFQMACNQMMEWVSIRSGDRSSPEGWYAPYYNTLEKAISVSARVRCQSVIFISVLSEEEVKITFEDETISFGGAGLDGRIYLGTGMKGAKSVRGIEFNNQSYELN